MPEVCKHDLKVRTFIPILGERYSSFTLKICTASHNKIWIQKIMPKPYLLDPFLTFEMPIAGQNKLKIRMCLPIFGKIYYFFTFQTNFSGQNNLRTQTFTPILGVLRRGSRISKAIVCRDNLNVRKRTS